MPLLWNKSLETGIPEIDKQHQHLINAMNELLEGIQAGRDKKTLKVLLSTMRDCASRHFGYEEMCMLQYKCPIAAKNKVLHAQFNKTFRALKQDLITNGPSPQLYTRIDKELLEWFGNHILGLDTQLKPCMPS